MCSQKCCPTRLHSESLAPSFGQLKIGGNFKQEIFRSQGVCLWGNWWILSLLSCRVSSSSLAMTPASSEPHQNHSAYCPWANTNLSLCKLTISDVWCSNGNLTNSCSLITLASILGCLFSQSSYHAQGKWITFTHQLPRIHHPSKLLGVLNSQT